MIILEKLLALAAVLLLIICMMAPLKKTAFAEKHPGIKRVVGFHAVYAWLLLAAGLAHGILAGKQPGMVTGKIAWMVLLVLILLTLLRRKMKASAWNLLHRVLSAAVCVMIVAHVIVAVSF